ncbi:hypothetical protein M378DRAFT_312813 [Amanita muscaria Koide BX008]|uniref:Uncharacterized protein n=1 Tax=Amanita muscaria (strain Koide BX008) TaxID=946122 RepID=A0A0C2WQM0_AMAMK|nr:hypothetical protein M378DRAFT_312813 [Amanita muscaria Koide BX008]
MIATKAAIQVKLSKPDKKGMPEAPNHDIPACRKHGAALFDPLPLSTMWPRDRPM